jgi:large subunit ribosomal protein L17e
LRVHFKNTYETGKAIKGMLLKTAQSYLRQVLDHHRCVPFTKYAGATGRTGQAKEWGLTKGRWPQKSVKVILSLLQNLASNAETKRLDVEKLVVKKVIVNQAMKGRRRTYRAHGRINAYLSSNCHVEIIAEEKKEDVKKAKVEKKENPQYSVSIKTKARRHAANTLRKNKYVQPKNSSGKAK